MRNSIKVGKWEIKRNLKNKSFVIGLFLTPLIFAAFAILPSLFMDFEEEPTQVFIKDELGVYPTIEAIVENSEHLDWDLEQTNLSEEEMKKEANEIEYSAFLILNEAAIEEGKVTVYMNEEVGNSFKNEILFIESILKEFQITKLGLTEEQLEVLSTGIAFDFVIGEDGEGTSEFGFFTDIEELVKRPVPGVFAGLILFSIVISGMMIFQSASQEKKDKMAEILLSSVTPNELMQGKIIGYFVLGLIQVTLWLAILLPIAIWKIDFPIIKYLLVPELAVLLLIAVLGYLMFASLFVGIGATIEDASSAGNFQGLVLMLPFVPAVLIGPVFSDPTGVVAQVGSYIPFTAPATLIVRLSILEEWPWIEIIIAIAILFVTVWLLMKLAGKIFRTGILMYGKNATPKEIWRWLWS